MEIKEYKTYNETEIISLYTSVGWTAYTDHPDVLRQWFGNSIWADTAMFARSASYQKDSPRGGVFRNKALTL